MAQSWPPWRGHAAVPYVAPFALFLLLTAGEGWIARRPGGGTPQAQSIAYAVKFVVVAVGAIRARRVWRDLAARPTPIGTLAAVLTGLGVTTLWVGLSGHYPVFRGLGTRVGLDPDLLSPAQRAAFTAVRITGLVLLVPLIEELFWRSFLIRWVQDQRFEQVPVGKVTLVSAAVTTLFFASAHPEWLPAVIAGVAWAILLWRTRSLFACVLSHAVANLALGIWILTTHAWSFW